MPYLVEKLQIPLHLAYSPGSFEEEIQGPHLKVCQLTLLFPWQLVFCPSLYFFLKFNIQNNEFYYGTFICLIPLIIFTALGIGLN